MPFSLRYTIRARMKVKTQSSKFYAIYRDINQNYLTATFTLCSLFLAFRFSYPTILRRGMIRNFSKGSYTARKSRKRARLAKRCRVRPPSPAGISIVYSPVVEEKKLNRKYIPKKNKTRGAAKEKKMLKARENHFYAIYL